MSLLDLDKYLANRRLEEQYHDYDIGTFGDELLKEINIDEIRKWKRSKKGS